MSNYPDQSNQELVDELTKDFQNQLQTESNLKGTNEDTNVIEPKSEEDEEVDFDGSDESSGDETQEEAKTCEDIDDLVDEEKLKELEISMSEEEIEHNRLQALELKKYGNEEYKQQKYLESVVTYTNALRICPLKYPIERSILYANRAASKINVDRKKSAIEDCSKSIELNDGYVRAYLRRGKLYEEEDKLDESLADFKKVLEIDPGCTEALSANHRLPPKIAEKNEKLKEEMLGKLKDLGNLILRPFGLSTDNFKLEQNPETGGYSVNFNQNKAANT